MAREVLTMLPPDEVGNINLFSGDTPDRGVTGVYSASTNMQPADGSSPDATEIRSALIEHFANDAELQRRAIELFDSPELLERIPDLVLRGAFAAQLGTVGEPAIEHFMQSARFTTIAYGTPGSNDLVAQSRTRTVDNTMYIVINDRYVSEDFWLIAPYIPHEILHDDSPDSGTEEAVNHAVTAVVYMQMLLRYPELAHSNTELARINNTILLGLLDSRPPNSKRVMIIAPDGRGIFPGSPKSTADFWSFFPNHGTTPAPVLLAQILEPILADEAELPEPLQFNEQLVQTIDANLDLSRVGLDDVQLVRLSVLLQLFSVDDIARQLDLDASEVVALFDLEPMLAAVDAGVAPSD